MTAPVPKPSVRKQPEHIARAEAKRQRTLAARRPAPDPAKTLSQHEYCWLKGFRSWSDLPVPIRVLLMRDRYVDGQAQEWALMSTRAYAQIPLLQFAREVLQLEGPACQKALAKVRLLEQSLLTPLNDSS